MPYEDVIVERDGAVAVVTLNRPQKLNAIRAQTAEELMAALEEAERDRQVRVVILAGAGGKAFCVGMDTAGFANPEGGEFERYAQRKRFNPANRLFRTAGDFLKPMLAAVEGYCLGGGLELALCADLIVAGETAEFGLPEARLGMMPGGGGTQRLPRRVGAARAKELIFTGDRVPAPRALAMGLVDRVAAAGGALAAAREMAAKIAENAPLPLMFAKQAVDRGAVLALADGLALETDLSQMLYFSDDRQEGLKAFAEKRKPNFGGK